MLMVHQSIGSCQMYKYLFISIAALLLITGATYAHACVPLPRPRPAEALPPCTGKYDACMKYYQEKTY